jgi:hypothetical protein
MVKNKLTLLDLMIRNTIPKVNTKSILDPGFGVTPPDTYNLRKKGIMNDPGFTAKPSGYKGKAMKTGGTTAAWTRSEGKNKTGGLNAKGVASYRAANPGSKLKTAVTTKPSKLKAGSEAAGRRKSFCSRMSGMKKKLTSAKTANDPNSRINKSLRKWNC